MVKPGMEKSAHFPNLAPGASGEVSVRRVSGLSGPESYFRVSRGRDSATVVASTYPFGADGVGNPAHWKVTQQQHAADTTPSVEIAVPPSPPAGKYYVEFGYPFTDR